MERDTVLSLSNVEILKGIIAEKLATAAQEIFAVVQRTVAGYEEEVSGYRREVERQRRQLEEAPLREIKVETDDEQLFSFCEPVEEEDGEGGFTEDEEQNKYEPGLENSVNVKFCYTEDQVEEPSKTSALKSTQELAPEPETLSRSLPPSVQFETLSVGRPLVSEPQNHIELRIHILDTQIDVLSAMDLTKYPLQELQCPRGLREVDFLDLLRSTFPQLAPDQPFDVLITDTSRRLQPLIVETLTPEEIIKTPGNSAVYIQLKKREEPRATDEDLHPPQRKEDTARPPDQSSQHPGSLLPRVWTARRKFGRRWLSERQNHIDLRIRIVEDSEIFVMSNIEFRKYPLQDLQCPRGLREADFLNLLRSTFPQLASDQPFDILITDRSRRLQPLTVKRLTPERIMKTPGNSALYIRLKKREEPRAADEDLHPPQRKEDTARAPDQSSQHPGSLLPRVWTARRKSGRRRIKERQNHIGLKIRIVEDSEIGFLSNIDRTRKLHPLTVETLTPEEIIKTPGNSAIYIRLKKREEPRATDEDLHPPQRKEDPARPSDQSSQHPGSFVPRIWSNRTKSGRLRLTEQQSYINLKIRIVEDSEIVVLSNIEFRKYPLQDLQCPRGLQEADFLNLLRSTFPQLAPDQPFDVLITDRSRRLQPLTVETLTPEEIINSPGNSSLYIRLKKREEPRATDEDLHPPQRKEDPARPSDQSSQHPGSLLPRVWSDRTKSGRFQLSEQQNHIDLRIRIVEDSEIGVLSNIEFRKYPLQDLQCPRGLQEADFLNLLRSTFPQLAPDQPFDVFIMDRSRKLQPLTVETLTPEEICRTLRSSNPSTLYIQLKSPERKAITNTALLQEKTLDVLSNISTSQEEYLRGQREAADGGHESIWSLHSLPLSENEQDVDDDDWEPHKREHPRNSETERATKRSRVTRVGTKRIKLRGTSAGAWVRNIGTPLSCKTCGALRGSMRMLIKHAWSHVEDAERLCGVCGVHSASAEELRSHLQRHQKTHSCNICGKSFLSASGIKGHIARHKGKRPYKCEICCKAFAEKSALTNHKWVHVLDKPYKCGICQKAYSSKFRLNLHKMMHTDKKPFSCNLCRKRLSSFESLSQHMVNHSGRTIVPERMYVCEICNKAFYTKQRLQDHVRNHSREKRYVCTKCNKGFSCSSNLMAHMRVHTG
ncbi:uncharacterized protein LOC113138951 isoform X2 [Mastacembelus armatus]|uniref:uncharacterized protein LOC113138951 isoform X2 n=1 Tax=Mastacembelus armatus TaxID=205130 RepID=UPI000E458DF6|nr:uncharacterized protein LOC113138951 isoform X2 [Mastacembelus armatus]